MKPDVPLPGHAGFGSNTAMGIKKGPERSFFISPGVASGVVGWLAWVS